MAVAEVRELRIPVDGGALTGDLATPPGARGVVVFAHGSGSSRHSRRNRAVASVFQEHRLATLLVDLLTPQEEDVDQHDARLRFDIELLARRVRSVVQRVVEEPSVGSLPIGLFGASTGAAAALTVAAREPALVRAVVSRGGRPDLAVGPLDDVRAPTLLVVGERDPQVIGLNQQAARSLRCEHRIVVIPRATHLFEEPGTLDRVAQIAAEWFERHLVPTPWTQRADVTESRPARAAPYHDRTEAGEVLARWIVGEAEQLHDPLVLALPRGGVEVAIPVANALDAPLDIVVARKIGVPSEPELALGAVDEDGARVIDRELQHALGLREDQVDELARFAHATAMDRARVLRGETPLVSVEGRDVVLVDDGYATGMTAVAAARWLRRHGARRIMLAVPVAPHRLVEHPPEEFDEVICPYTPSPFRAVGHHYRRFAQVSDAEVREQLRRAAGRQSVHAGQAGPVVPGGGSA
jgi:predicted phosphoribosyltransferase/dienelactone hydrolase